MSPVNRIRHAQPRLVDERKPLRPVRVADVRKPVAVTKPIALGGDFFSSGPAGFRKDR